jgi:signal transduction histidine kinase
MAAHDLRNPLHVIHAFSELLLEEGDVLDADLMEMVTVMRDSSAFMTRLVNDLLDVAKIESGELHLEREKVDLVELVERSVHLNRVLAGRKNIALEFQPISLPKLHLDPNKIAQVFNNLLSNAIKFSYPGSEVQVTLEESGGQAVVSVADEGQGIPEEDFEKLFKPYAKASVRSTDGEESTGLGLVIVRKIVDGHGGKIWVESEVGKGSTFHVKLPIA